MHESTHPVVRDRGIRVLKVRNGDNPAPISPDRDILLRQDSPVVRPLPTSKTVSELNERVNMAKTDQPRDKVDPPHCPCTRGVHPEPEEYEHAEDENVRDDDEVSCVTHQWSVGCRHAPIARRNPQKARTHVPRPETALTLACNAALPLSLLY